MSIAATAALWIFVGLFALITVALIGAIAFALTKLVKLLETVVNKLDPIVAKATDTIETVQRVTTNVGEKADQILTKGEALTDDVSGRVEKTAGVVQHAVTEPLINLSSLITGISKGFAVYTHSSGKNGARGAKVAAGGAEVYGENGKKKR